MRLLPVIVVILFVLQTGCAGGVDSRPLDELQSASGKAPVYMIRSGDTLNVQVWGEPEVSGEVFVRDDGKVSIKLINEIHAQGLTIEEFTKNVTQELKRYIPAASVVVSVVQSAPVKYFLLGAFQRPGEHRSEGSVTFLQAIATGGGFAPFANPGTVTLIRKSPDGEKRYVLDYNEVISGDEPNPQLQSGDVLAVE